MLNQTFLRAAWGLADKPCSWRVNRPSAELVVAYRVGSVNFSRRKLGHAHDNSVDSENVAGVREPSVHSHFIFRFENCQGNQSLFSTHAKIQLKRVSHKLSRRTVDVPSTGRFCEASSGPEKLKFGSARLSRKKANFVDNRKLLLTLYVPIIAILDIWKTTLFYEGESVVYDGFKYVWPIKG